MEPLLPVWFTAIVTGSLLLLVFVVIYKVAADEFRHWRLEQRKEELRKQFAKRPHDLSIMPLPHYEETQRE